MELNERPQLEIHVDEAVRRESTDYRAAVEEAPGRFHASRAWSRDFGGFLFLFALAWLGFLVFWYAIVFLVDAPPVFPCFGGIFVVIGVVMLWTSLAKLLNRTTLRVENARLTRSAGPVPSRATKVALALEEVSAFEATLPEAAFFWDAAKRERSRWRVVARLRNREEVDVLDDLDRAEAEDLARRLQGQLS